MRIHFEEAVRVRTTYLVVLSRPQVPAITESTCFKVKVSFDEAIAVEVGCGG
jgi:hypothetical protein